MKEFLAILFAALAFHITALQLFAVSANETTNEDTTAYSSVDGFLLDLHDAFIDTNNYEKPELFSLLTESSYTENDIINLEFKLNKAVEITNVSYHTVGFSVITLPIATDDQTYIVFLFKVTVILSIRILFCI